MIIFPNCKINLGLHITGRRSDGFHDIETVFYPVHLSDVLEVIPGGISGNESDGVLFTTSGIPVDATNENNLCIKAFRLLKKDFPGLPVIALHLHKAIPIGAGLGGGSADAAFTLKLLNDKFQLNLSTDQLLHYSIQLGSDCPFFIMNSPCFATGRGEVLEPVNRDLSVYKFVLVNPGIHIQTASAFSQSSPALPAKSIKTIIHQPLSTWKDELKNDFEKGVFKQYPVIKNIKEEMYAAGAVYASMSGSGSTVYGIFENEKDLHFSFPSDYFVRELLR